MLHIGITGGIGSGKSTVTQLWVGCGAHAIDADQLSRELTQSGGAAMPLIRAAFGDMAIGSDGAMDRARMREWVFSSPELKAKLEGILHPMIGEESRRLTELARQSGAQVLVHDIPLLVETGKYKDKLDRILVVDCPLETQVSRVMARSAMERDAVLRIIQAQATREARLAVADWVILNEHKSLLELKKEVKALYALALELA